MTCGIYCIENKVNGKKYVGQATTLNSRWKTHINQLNKNNHINKHLQNAWSKDGKENFSFSILEECEEIDLTIREQFWIDFYKSMDREFGYNKREAGSKGKLSEETKSKIGQANKGRPQTKESIEKRAVQLRGKHLSKETIEKISLSNKGKKVSEETRRKIGDAQLGEKHYMFGKKRTQEAIEKTILANTGQKRNNEVKQKMSNQKIGSKNNKSSSLFLGVRFSKHHNRWMASIQINKKNIHIGSFKLEIDAAKSYDKYVMENNLNRKLNFPNDYNA